jgi:hypothetical protein
MANNQIDRANHLLIERIWRHYAEHLWSVQQIANYLHLTRSQVQWAVDRHISASKERRA